MRNGKMALLVVVGLSAAACASDDERATTTEAATDETTETTTPTTTAPTIAAAPTTEVESTTTEATPTEPTPTTVVDVVDPDVSVTELDCADQLPSYVEDRIPDGAASPRLSCWSMNTLEDYGATDADARRIDVTYYIWQSAAAPDDRSADPIVYLPGGPRGSAYNSLIPFTNVDVQGTRDLILVDTRGNSPVPGDDTGIPRSGCPELYDTAIAVFAANESIGAEYTTLLDGWQTCLDRLQADGWDLAQYNTKNAIEDLEQLRSALGIDQWNVYGESYSTRYMLEYLRQHPDAIRAAVIDSATPPDTAIWAPATVGAAVDAVFQTVVDGCAASAECSESFGDVRANLDAAVARLDETPRTVEITHPLTGEPATVSIDGRDLAFGIGELLDPATLPAIPGIVAAIAAGDDALIDASAASLLGIADGGLGLSAATVCHDFGIDPNRVMASVDSAVATDGPWEHLGYLSNMPCEIVDVPPADQQFNEPVVSDVPTLVVVGLLDSSTLPADGLAVADQLANATRLVFEYEGHVPVRTSECAQQIARAFWDDFDAVDASCAAAANAQPIVSGG
ncbi:MAG: alpha/beta fold hydrolase [Actinomycetota bacterium]